MNLDKLLHSKEFILYCLENEQLFINNKTNYNKIIKYRNLRINKENYFKFLYRYNLYSDEQMYSHYSWTIEKIEKYYSTYRKDKIKIILNEDKSLF